MKFLSEDMFLVSVLSNNDPLSFWTKRCHREIDFHPRLNQTCREKDPDTHHSKYHSKLGNRLTVKKMQSIRLYILEYNSTLWRFFFCNDLYFFVYCHTHTDNALQLFVFLLSLLHEIKPTSSIVSKLSNSRQHTANVSLIASIIVIIISLDLSFESNDLNI